MEGAEEAGEEIMVDSKDLQKQSKALDKLTDRVEDRQLDSSRVQSADLNAKRLREKELASVKINAADVELIVNELELEKNVVERTLRENKGDAVAATMELLSRYPL
uniref:Nascent polypeptide-associated complex subunit alpha-like UBA domain-containing protein n=1 Tax=Brassica oleracea var. oleracea TaxID=109376 RepID=A0A0D3AFA3_BRAOL